MTPGEEYRKFESDSHRHLACVFVDLASGGRGGRQKLRSFEGFCEGSLWKPKRRRRVVGLEDAPASVRLCCQVGRFGFALDSPQRRLRPRDRVA